MPPKKKSLLPPSNWYVVCCRSLALGQQYSSLGSQPILCGSIPGLVPKQLRFCRNYIEIMPSVAEGVKLGIQECQHQFRGRRWNCTTIKDNLAIFGPVLDKGTRPQSAWLAPRPPRFTLEKQSQGPRGGDRLQNWGLRLCRAPWHKRRGLCVVSATGVRNQLARVSKGKESRLERAA